LVLAFNLAIGGGTDLTGFAAVLKQVESGHMGDMVWCIGEWYGGFLRESIPATY